MAGAVQSPGAGEGRGLILRAPVWLALLAAVLAAALTGCAGPGRHSQSGYRDQTIPITSTTRFRADRFAGDWVRVAAFDPATLASGCHALRFRQTPAGRMTLSACGAPATAYRVAPHGRLIPEQESGAEPLWVLWVDDQFRTAVIGTPSGRLGWVLNRSADIPADRRKATETILDFNGYAVERLRLLL